jgi:UDP-N-acetylmuramate: L-alanyl-gamma-D-glutamyl-meso-diaminopimelate ligase
MELHTFSSLNAAFLKQYEGTMQDADTAIVYIDAKTFEQKQMTPLSEADIKEAFAANNILFFDDPIKLETYLRSLNYDKTNLLLMSSGTYAGIDLVKLSQEIDT